MTTSLGLGISLKKSALLMRVLTNSTAVPTSELVWNPDIQAPRASDQKSPSWCCRIFRSTKRSKVLSMIDSALGASLSIQYWALYCSGSCAISARMGSRQGSPVTFVSRRIKDSMSVSMR